MDMSDLAVIGYASQALAFAVLSIVFLVSRNASPFSVYLGVASAASSMSGGVHALQLLGIISFGSSIVVVEWARIILWITALFAILRTLDEWRLAETYARRYVVPVLAVALIGLVTYGVTKLDSLPLSLVVSGGVLFGLASISLLEQIYRNLPSDSSSSLKYLCVALLVVNAYDIVVFLRVISAGAIEVDPWGARGFVNSLAAVPLALSSRRGAFDTFADMPRQIASYKFSLLAIGFSIMAWLLADYYVAIHGGAWGTVATIVLGTGSLYAAGILLVSASVRARVRVFLTKFFFRYKYDYRKEWLRFISTLSESGFENVSATAVRAVAQIVNSPGGIVWVQEQEGKAYVPIGSWRCEIPSMSPINGESGLVRFLTERKWVIDLEEKQRYPARYGDLELDSCFQGSDDWWLIVPLFLGKRLFGFVWLKKPRVVRSLNFEDHDLLRTVGRHVGMHINQAESDKRLAEISQFGTYDRLTAFLMHDLNNLIAQQSLVVTNAERFRDNPEFVDDAIATIANSVSRMKRLMEQLTRGFKGSAPVRTDLCDALIKAVKRSKALRPEPKLVSSSIPINILADPERLTNIFEHLIRNAQDATADSGQIEIGTRISDESVCVSISDSGEGMSQEFIRERLFRPFDSTKGSHAMGIGVYQARDYVRTLGGQMDVSSAIGVGTVFTIRLPVSD